MLLINLVYVDHFAVGHMNECNQTARRIELVFGMGTTRADFEGRVTPIGQIFSQIRLAEKNFWLICGLPEFY